jgi:hypothetical protein
MRANEFATLTVVAKVVAFAIEIVRSFVVVVVDASAL